jgi:hypothetical protein
MSANRRLEGGFSRRCQLGRLSAIEVRLDLSADLLEFFLGYGHKNRNA